MAINPLFQPLDPSPAETTPALSPITPTNPHASAPTSIPFITDPSPPNHPPEASAEATTTIHTPARTLRYTSVSIPHALYEVSRLHCNNRRLSFNKLFTYALGKLMRDEITHNPALLLDLPQSYADEVRYCANIPTPSTNAHGINGLKPGQPGRPGRPGRPPSLWTRIQKLRWCIHYQDPQSHPALRLYATKELRDSLDAGVGLVDKTQVPSFMQPGSTETLDDGYALLSNGERILTGLLVGAPTLRLVATDDLELMALLKSAPPIHTQQHLENHYTLAIPSPQILMQTLLFDAVYGEGVNAYKKVSGVSSVGMLCRYTVKTPSYLAATHQLWKAQDVTALWAIHTWLLRLLLRQNAGHTAPLAVSHALSLGNKLRDMALQPKTVFMDMAVTGQALATALRLALGEHGVSHRNVQNVSMRVLCLAMLSALDKHAAGDVGHMRQTSDGLVVPADIANYVVV